MSGEKLIQTIDRKVITPIMLGEHARFQRVHGDIVASYQYINDERAMVLWPRVKKMNPGAFVVCDSAAWRYNPDHQRSDWFAADGTLLCGPLYLMQQAARAATVMQMDTTKPTIIRIAGVIAEGLEDLVRLPPRRPQDKPKTKPIGEAALVAGGKVLSEKEI